ncbi:MAG: hypothetical protein ACLS3Y_12425, partial [Collinsella sp.]
MANAACSTPASNAAAITAGTANNSGISSFASKREKRQSVIPSRPIEHVVGKEVGRGLHAGTLAVKHHGDV